MFFNTWEMITILKNIKIPKQIKLILILILTIAIIYTVIVMFLIFRGTREQPSQTPDTVLILGAQVKGDTKEKAYPSIVLRERLDAATDYIKEHPEVTVIVCGGQGADEPDSEANVMKKYLVKQGISEEKIITEDTSTRTKENIQNAQKKQSLNDTVIVTSDFHVFRSKLLAKRLGIKTISGLPSKTKNSAVFKSYTREIIALGYGLLFDW